MLTVCSESGTRTRTGLSAQWIFYSRMTAGLCLLHVFRFRRQVYSLYTFKRMLYVGSVFHSISNHRPIIAIFIQLGVLHILKACDIHRISLHSHQLFPSECSLPYLYNYLFEHDNLDIKVVDFLILDQSDYHLYDVIPYLMVYLIKQIVHNIHIYFLFYLPLSIVLLNDAY